MEDKKGFWGCLFDLSFSELITLKIIRVLYIIGITLAALAGVYLVVEAFLHTFGTGLLLVICAPVVFVLLVICCRVKMELLLTLFRIEENTRKCDGGVVEAEIEAEITEPEPSE